MQFGQIKGGGGKVTGNISGSIVNGVNAAALKAVEVCRCHWGGLQRINHQHIRVERLSAFGKGGVCRCHLLYLLKAGTSWRARPNSALYEVSK